MEEVTGIVSRDTPLPRNRRHGIPMLTLLPAMIIVTSLVLTGCSSGSAASVGTLPITIGAVYPISTGGSPAQNEYHGFLTAVKMVNASGGVHGRPVHIDLKNVTVNTAAGAVFTLAHHDHVTAIVGSESSFIGLQAAPASQAAHTIYLENGAVATMITERGQPDVFRTVTTGQTLGRNAAKFAAQVIAPRLHILPRNLRVAVVYNDDVYGSSVAKAQIFETHALGMHLVGTFSYFYPGVNFHDLVSRLKRVKPNVVLVAAYVPDAIAFRKETIRQHLRVGAMIGTSSSFCMLTFAKPLKWDAVGLFAADKPDWTVNSRALLPAARRLRTEANTLYLKAYKADMNGPAIAGFVGGWVLLHDVLPRARSLTRAAIRTAFLSLNLPYGSEINGAGVYFARPAAPDAGQNVRAVGVIWQWQTVDHAKIVAPPLFATGDVKYVPLPLHITPRT
jgi:branched-chain amino acid transport system substrate-binding protein